VASHRRLIWLVVDARTLPAVPGARVELVDGAGHSPKVEAPEKTLALIADFLSIQ
jgi:pimeloyl-ACP methyl ester carboxylesterase